MLQNRTRDSRHDWQNDVRSPLNAGLTGYTLPKTPFLKLIRHYQTDMVDAFVSADGAEWTKAGSLFTPFPETVHAGLATTGTSAFSKVHVQKVENNALQLSGSRIADQVGLESNKPDASVEFEVFRTDSVATALTDPLIEGAGWTSRVKQDAVKVTDQLRQQTISAVEAAAAEPESDLAGLVDRI